MAGDVITLIFQLFISLSSLIFVFVDVEDGHTLHLVVRQPIAPAGEQSDQPGLICFGISLTC